MSKQLKPVHHKVLFVNFGRGPESLSMEWLHRMGLATMDTRVDAGYYTGQAYLKAFRGTFRQTIWFRDTADDIYNAIWEDGI